MGVEINPTLDDAVHLSTISLLYFGVLSSRATTASVLKLCNISVVKNI